MSLHTWMVLPFTILCTRCAFSESGTVLRDVFSEADITIIFTPEYHHLFDEEACFSYFHIVREINLYTPIRAIILTKDDFDDPISSTSLTIHRYRATEKSARYKTMFVKLDWRMGLLPGGRKCEYLVHIGDAVLQQEYVFGQIDRSRDTACLRRHAALFRSKN